MITLILLLVLSGVWLREDDSGAECQEEQETISGRLSLIGHEPFIRTAVITDEDERYILKADPNLTKKMWQSRSKVEVTGRCFEDQWYAQPSLHIEVESWKPITNE